MQAHHSPKSAEIKESSPTHWQTRPLLETFRLEIAARDAADLKSLMTRELEEAIKTNSFRQTFFDLRFSKDGEFYPPCCQIRYRIKWDCSAEIVIFFYSYDKRTFFNSEEEETADYMRWHELSRFKNKVDSLLTQSKIQYEWDACSRFIFKSQDQFFNALNVLANADILPSLPSSLAELSKQYQTELQTALAEIDYKGEEAFAIYNATYEADARFSGYLLQIKEYKKTFNGIANKKKDAFEQLLNFMGSPMLVVFIEHSRSFLFAIKATPFGKFFNAFENVFCPIYSKYNYPSGVEDLLTLKTAGDTRIDAILKKVMPGMTYDHFIDFFRCAREGRSSAKTILNVLELNGRHIEMLIDDDKKLESLQNAINSSDASVRPKLQAWFLRFSQTRFKTQSAALAQSRLPLQVIKRIMLFANSDTGTMDEKKLGAVFDAATKRWPR